MFGSILHDKTHCHANHTPSLNTLLILGTSSTILQGNSYIGDPGQSRYVPYAVDDEIYINPPRPQGHDGGYNSNQFVCNGAISYYIPSFATLVPSATMAVDLTWIRLPPYFMNSTLQKKDDCKLSLCMICNFQINEVAYTKTMMLTITANVHQCHSGYCYLLTMSRHLAS
jgi:hypothetical protein